MKLEINENYPQPKLVAEIGCNHKGEFEIAKDMIETAKRFCDADVVKFQKRTPKELLTEEEYNNPPPVPRNSYGESYGKHREYLEFDIEQHRELKEFCENLGITYSTSVWDMTSTKEVVDLNPEMIKIPSANSTYWELLQYLCDNYEGDIHLSTGMTSRNEVEKIVDFFINNERNEDLIIYHCTSGYPVPFEDTKMLEVANLYSEYKDKVKSIGFSGHHKGIAIDVAAYTLGAEWVERHYTLDRTWKGTDHAASLEPNGVRKLKRNLLATYESLNFRPEGLLEIEKPQAKKLRWDRQNLNIGTE